MNICEKLIFLRQKKTWTQEGFCKAFNRRYPELAINRAQYSKWEIYPAWNITIAHIKALATFYQITTDELLFDHLPLSIFKSKTTLKAAPHKRKAIH